MSDFEIKPASEVPDNSVPARKNKKYPFGEMEVGTAFHVPADHPGAQKSPGSPNQSRVTAAAHTYGRANGMKFRTSTQPDGSVRIERVK